MTATGIFTTISAITGVAATYFAYLAVADRVPPFRLRPGRPTRKLVIIVTVAAAATLVASIVALLSIERPGRTVLEQPTGC